MKFLKYSIIIVSSIIVVLLLIPFITFVILHYWILTPQFLTSATKDIVKEYTFLKFDCKSIELDYMDSWPSISLVINEGEIEIPNTQDSISTEGKIDFKKIHGNIQLSELLVQKKLQIENIFVEQPTLNLKIREKAPILLKKNKDKKKNNKIDFSINQIDVTKANVYLTGAKKSQNINIEDASISIAGDLTSQQPTFSFKTNCKEVGGKAITQLLGKNVSFKMAGDCSCTEKFNNIAVSDALFYINQFPFRLEGTFSDLKKKKEAHTDIKFNLLSSNLKEIMDFIPSHLLPEKSQYIVNGETSLEGSIKGKIAGTTPPYVKMKCLVDNGSLYKKDFNKGIDTISLNMNVSYFDDIPDSCYIKIENTKIKGLDSYIEVESHINNLQNIPFITADFKGSIDFDCIGKEFIASENAQLNGKMESNLSVAFNLKDWKEQNLSKIWIDGTFNSSNISIQIPQYNLNLFGSGTEASIGYKKNRSDFIKTEDVLSTIIKVDTLKMEYDNAIYLNLSKLNIRSNTSLAQQDKSSTPVTAHMTCQKLQTKLSANRWISAEGIALSAGSKSIKTTPKTEAACIIKTDKFQYIDDKEQNAIALKDGEFITELHPGNNNKWDIKGLVEFKESKIYTSHYPIDIQANQARLSFRNNQLSINHLKLNAGNSDCILSGILTTNENPKPNEPKIDGTLHLLADYIDYNELKQTLLYHDAEEQEFRISNINDFHVEDLNHHVKGAVKEEPFYIPKGLELNLRLNVNNMNYEEVALHQLNGDIHIKNQKAHSILATRTNLGKANLSVLYDSADKDNINTLFDLKLKDVLVAQIHNVLPSVDTLFPMTSSMDGLVDCHLTIASKLDNQMFPVLPSATAALSFEGKNLTLMDNKVFQDIAKKLLLKNKKRNIIDNISANIILQDEQIEVIPFPMKWDRYEAIIGGSHSLDFSYNYHVTLLKSPIPIDFGIQLSGKTEDFHYKIGKCKYKDLYRDGGVEHNQKTKERLDLLRNRIIEKIKIE